MLPKRLAFLLDGTLTEVPICECISILDGTDDGFRMFEAAIAQEYLDVLTGKRPGNLSVFSNDTRDFLRRMGYLLPPVKYHPMS